MVDMLSVDIETIYGDRNKAGILKNSVFNKEKPI